MRVIKDEDGCCMNKARTVDFNRLPLPFDYDEASFEAIPTESKEVHDEADMP